MAYVWPDGSVTGSIHWDELRESVKNRDHEGVTDEGWERLDALIADHDDAVKGVESEAVDRAKAAAKANVEAGALEPANTPSDDADAEGDTAPVKADNKAAWVDYAEAQGLDREEAEALTKAELVERYSQEG